jgi:S-DNA-T family DNA segregation ATPase FtsK/SpoIIIE
MRWVRPDTTALKIMHACRFQDIQLVLGRRGAEGWRPDRLHPANVLRQAQDC